MPSLRTTQIHAIDLVSLGAFTLMSPLFVTLAVERDFISLGLALAIPLVPIVVFATLMSLKGAEPYASILAIVILISQGSNFRIREYANAVWPKPIDHQIIMKVAFVGLMAVLCVGTVRFILSQRVVSVTGMWVVFFVYMMFTSFLTDNYLLGLTAGLSILIGLFYALHIIRYFGRERSIWIVTIACFIQCLLSIIVYFALPSFGRMSEWINDQYILTSRLQGVLGSANLAGAVSSFGILISCLLLKQKKRSFFFVFMNAVFVFCLIASNNRMGLVAVAASLSMFYITRGSGPLKVALIMAGAGVTILLFYLLSDTLLVLLSRSGSADEVLSATGRSRIWPVALQLWSEHPVFGLGYTSTIQILPTHPALFDGVAHTHNLFIQVLFSGGAVGLGIFLLCVGASVKKIINSGLYAEFSLMFFFLVYGLTEPVLNYRLDYHSFSLLFTIAIAIYAPQSSSAIPRLQSIRRSSLPVAS